MSKAREKERFLEILQYVEHSDIDQAELSEWLVDRINEGANILKYQDDRGISLLHIGILKLDYRTVRLMVQDGAKVNCKTQEGMTPLHAAVSRGDKQIVKLILEEKASVNARMNDGSTALQISAEKGRHSIVKLLVKHGANISAEDKDKQTAYMRTEDVRCKIILKKEELRFAKSQANIGGIFGAVAGLTIVSPPMVKLYEYIAKIIKAKYGKIGQALYGTGMAVVGITIPGIGICNCISGRMRQEMHMEKLAELHKKKQEQIER